MLADFTAIDLWIIATAAVCAVACSLVGSFLILRRQALIGDAVSHSILPGLAMAFILTGSRAPMPMLLGALIAGVGSAFLTAFLAQRLRVDGDAAMGIVFTSFFALGVILITATARIVDLDPGCVLYGLLEFSPFDTVPLLGFEVPRAFVWLSIMLFLNLSMILAFFKELVLHAFDSQLATTLGFSSRALHYVFMTLVTATAVASFEAVGSIIVISMLITPSATAFLLTKRVSTMLVVAAVLAVVSAVLGYLFALRLNTSVAGMMSVVSGGLFGLAVIASPRQGIMRQLFVTFMIRLQITTEDLLGAIYRRRERHGDNLMPAQFTANRVLLFLAIRRLKSRGIVTASPEGTLSLTEHGMHEATSIVRSHRLWESYLIKYLPLAADHVHSPSEMAEHYTDASMINDLASEVAEKTDPHGRAIPEDSRRKG